MRVICFLFLTAHFFLGCQSHKAEKKWIYLELAINNQDTTDEYLYGQIDANMLNKLKSEAKTTQIFSIENIRYITLEDSVEIEENENLVGTNTFYSEDVRKIVEFKKDPLLTDLGYPLSARSMRIKEELLKKNNP
jgi:hypothetical protein